MFPAQIQVQYPAVPPVHTRRVLVNGDGTVTFPGIIGIVLFVPGQSCGVVSAPFRVKAPVLAYPIAGVGDALAHFIVARRVDGCDFQHKLRRLAPFRNSVTPLPDDGVPVHIKGNQQIGNQYAAALVVSPAHRQFADDQEAGMGSGQVTPEGRLPAGFVQNNGVVHIVPRRKIGELLDGWSRRVGRRHNGPGSHSSLANRQCRKSVRCPTGTGGVDAAARCPVTGTDLCPRRAPWRGCRRHPVARRDSL